MKWSTQIRIEKQKKTIETAKTDRDHEDDAHNISLINGFRIIQ